MKISKYGSPLLIFVALLTLSSCRPPADRAGNDNIFRYNSVGGMSTLDPAFARSQSIIWAVNQLYNSLLQFDDELNIIPAVAESWNISEDGLTYTFHLRDDIFFIDDECFPGGRGRKLVAGDVVYSFNRLMDPAVASPGSWIFRGRISEENPFEAPDDQTFILRLQDPFHPMLGILTMQYTSIVPPEAVEFYGREFRRNPVGTGPFMLKSWREEEALILMRNPNYWETLNGEQLPFLDEVVVSYNENKATEFLLFLNHDLDFVSDIDHGLRDLVLDLEGNLQQRYHGDFQLIRAPYLNTEYLGFTIGEAGAQSPVMIAALREAINLGFDRRQLVRFLRNNKGTPAFRGMIPQGLPGFAEEADFGFEYDPEKAARILADAGYPRGEGLPVLTLYAPPAYTDIGEFLQNQLRQLGIQIDVAITQFSILRGMMEDGAVEFFRGSWIADYPDAESYMALFYSEHGAPPNYTRFQNKEFDRLYRQAVREQDDQVRNVLYRQMDSLVMSQSVVVPLFYDEVYRFVHNNIEGLGVNPMNLLVLKYVRKR